MKTNNEGIGPVRLWCVVPIIDAEYVLKGDDAMKNLQGDLPGRRLTARALIGVLLAR